DGQLIEAFAAVDGQHAIDPAEGDVVGVTAGVDRRIDPGVRSANVEDVAARAAVDLHVLEPRVNGLERRGQLDLEEGDGIVPVDDAGPQGEDRAGSVAPERIDRGGRVVEGDAVHPFTALQPVIALDSVHAAVRRGKAYEVSPQAGVQTYASAGRG